MLTQTLVLRGAEGAEGAGSTRAVNPPAHIVTARPVVTGVVPHHLPSVGAAGDTLVYILHLLGDLILSCE